MLRLNSTFLSLCLFWLMALIGAESFISSAQALEILGFRIGAHEARTRIVLDLSEKAQFKVKIITAPHRAVIDLPFAQSLTDISDMDKGLVQGVRFGTFDPETSRVVLDLRGAVKVQKQFILPPSASSPYHRLVVDLVPSLAPPKAPPSVAQAPKVPKLSQNPTPKTAPPSSIYTPKPRPKNTRKVIVIDPGHGGVDPGALGRKVYEKQVVLTFAKELARQLRAAGYEVHLTRQNDVYIPLRQRVQIARNKNADLFMSIHADAIKKKNVRGLSIYTLSEKASDKEAAALARKENQSDIIAGIDFADQPEDVANILIDLAQRETKNLSVKFANNVVQEAGKETKLLDRTHRFAGFRVLKAPDVPSVLIELGFLTNRNDEKQLVSSKWRQRVATSFVRAINQYFNQKQQSMLQ